MVESNIGRGVTQVSGVQDDDAGETKGKLIGGDEVAELRNQLAAERSALAAEREQRSRAENERDQERSVRQDATASRWHAEETALDTSLSAWDNERAGLKATIGALQGEGKFEEAAAAYDRLAEIAAEMRFAKQQKIWLEQAKQVEKDEIERAKAAAKKPVAGNGGHDLSGYTAKERRWIREHPEYLEDEGYRQKVVRAHHSALGNGYARDTEEYFDHLNEALEARAEPKRRARDDDEEEERPVVKRNGSGELAGSRRAAGSGPRRDDPVRLSADEREAADITLSHLPQEDMVDVQGNVTPGRYRQYVLHREALKSQGRLN